MKNLLFLIFIIPLIGFAQCEVTHSTAPCSAEFPGGVNELRKWMQTHSTYFPKQEKMQASATFTIDTLGKATYIEVLSNVQDSAMSGYEIQQKSNEIIRLLETMPAWKPAGFGKDCKFKVCEIHTLYFYFYSKEMLEKLKQENKL